MSSKGPDIPSAQEQNLPLWLGLTVLLLAALMVTGFIHNPIAFAYNSTATFGALCVLYAMLRFGAALSKRPKSSDLGRDELPVFSILLPVYNEAHMIESLVSHITALDYPPTKLDVMIICEPDDTDTIAAARLVEGVFIKVFVTPGTGPRTKPNALNAAMETACGEIITVYDAEDRPHANQLRAAAYALGQDPRLAVVQAPLTYYNANQNWLTRQFTLEYAALFYVWIPFLAKLGLPFPLGGTSNHIRGLM